MYLKPLHLPKACILVLEEDTKLRTALCNLLIDAGYTVADAESGANTVGHVDLVLAGIGAQCGPSAPLDLLERAVPAIALVDRRAWTGFDFFDAANDLGAVAVLQRPFTRAALLHLMATILSNPERETAPAEDDDADEAGPADLLPHLDHSHFA
jgi:DNA-binding NtrC family response regulator